MKELFAMHNGRGSTITAKEGIRVFGMTVCIKASSEETDNAFCVVESTLPAHYRMVLPHWHAHKSEAFYVIDGTLTFTREDQTFIVQRGGFVLAPPRTVHVYWNSTTRPVTFLTVSAPGGLDGFLAELAEVFAERPYDATLITEIATRYDQHAPVEQNKNESNQ
jgi:quercetin dioxygenase-like cupin family protein